MGFAHIYARRDGTFTVHLGGEVTTDKLAGKVNASSAPFGTEVAARFWVAQAADRWGLPDMPEPKVIRR